MRGSRDSYLCELLRWAVVDTAQDLPPKRLLGVRTVYAIEMGQFS